MADRTLNRQWAMLRMLPRYPRALSTQEIFRRLKQKGYSVTDRTIARDLATLSETFPITSDTQGRTNSWCWAQDAAVMDVPGIEPAVALAWLIGRSQLEGAVPAATLEGMQPYFERAEAILKEGGNRLARWRRKFRNCQRGPRLTAPPVDPSVQEMVHQAVLEEKQIELDYVKRGQAEAKMRRVHPHGVVLLDGVVYLVATVDGFEEAVQFALHRVKAAKVLEQSSKAPKGFDLDAYIEREFRYPLSPEMIRLECRFTDDVGTHLKERPLSADQVFTDFGDGAATVAATVGDTEEMRWWLQGFGRYVEVLKPASLRREFAEVARQLAAAYGVRK